MGQDWGGSPIPTTPYEGRTIESGLEDIRGGVDIGVDVPTAGANIGAAILRLDRAILQQAWQV